jgi:predicted Na+-dependent transporter
MIPQIRNLIRDHARMLAMITPAFIANYVVVVLLQVEFEFKSFWIINAVVVGDVVGYLINVWVFRRFGYPASSRNKHSLESTIEK